jgi:WD40 repeat protein
LAADLNERVVVWDWTTGKPRHDFGHAFSVGAVVYSPDGKTIVSGARCYDPTIRVWESQTGRLKGEWRGHAIGVQDLAFSPDGKLVASGSQDGTVRLWDFGKGHEIHLVDAKDGRVYSLTFSPDGKTVVSGGDGKAVHFWDVANGQELRAVPNPGRGIRRLRFSPDGKTLAGLILWDLVQLWDGESGKELRAIRDPGRLTTCLAFSPDSKFLATGSGRDGSIRLWEVASGQEYRVLTGSVEPGARGPGGVHGLAFSPDGRMVAAGYDDRTVRIWEVRSGQERVSFEGHLGIVGPVAFSPDGSLLASGSGDMTMLIWDVWDMKAQPKPGWDRLDVRSLEALWSDLASRDAGRAFQASQTMMRGSRESVPFLARRLGDLEGDLLLELPDGMRPYRVVEVLENIGTTEARNAIKNMTTGVAGAQLIQEAKASLQRLSRRSVTP